MKPTIEALWNGNVSPMDEPSFDYDDAQDLRSFVKHDIDSLTNTLDNNEKKLLESIEKQYEELIDIYSRDAFKKGFSLGAKLTGEAFTE